MVDEGEVELLEKENSCSEDDEVLFEAQDHLQFGETLDAAMVHPSNSQSKQYSLI